MCNQHIVRELSFFEEKYSWAASMKTLLLQACEDPLSNSFDQWQNAYLKILKAGKLEIGYKPEKPLKQGGRAAKPKELNLSAWINIEVVFWHLLNTPKFRSPIIGLNRMCAWLR